MSNREWHEDQTIGEISMRDQEIDRLKMSNVKLIAELGMIAEALGAKPDMRDVLDKIEALKAAVFVKK